jgi:E3 ubiquitin-protein ligase RGLG
MGGVLGALLGGHRRAGRTQVVRHRGLAPQPSMVDGGRRRAMLSKKYSFIPDTYTSLDQVPPSSYHMALTDP